MLNAFVQAIFHTWSKMPSHLSGVGCAPQIDLGILDDDQLEPGGKQLDNIPALMPINNISCS